MVNGRFRERLGRTGAGGALVRIMMAAVLLAFATLSRAETVLEDVGFASLSGDQVQVRLRLSGVVPEPTSFSTESPPRIALDFTGTRNGMTRRTTAIDAGVVRSVTAVEAGDRTRVIIDLTRPVPFETEIQGNELVVTLASSEVTVARSGRPKPGGPSLEKVDFRRGDRGSGRVFIRLSSSDIPMDVTEQGGRVLVKFPHTALPEDQERKLDVVDFATPVKSISTTRRGGEVRVVIDTLAPFEHLAYQSDNVVTVEVRPLSEREREARQREKERRREYTGERLSLNFQNIEVRAVLQLLADFTGLNVVVSDEVQGSVTLRLKNVPWDQALDIILDTKQLGMRRTGNVLLVAPAERLHAQEKQALEAEKVVSDLAPLRSEMIQLNYAKAGDIAALLNEKENSLLSERGNVAVDERTNTLLVQDTASNLDEIRELVAELDIPIRQVLIESRVVVASSTFARELGVRFGFTGAKARGDNGLVTTSGSVATTDEVVGAAALNRLANIDNGVLNPESAFLFPKNQQRQVRTFPEELAFDNRGNFSPIGIPAIGEITRPGSLSDPGRLNVDLPVENPAGRIALAILGVDYLIDLELSALQTEGQGEVISNPRVLTGNNQTAIIEQGEETKFIARGDNSSSLDSIQALLSLQVTPTITPDDRVLMDLEITDDQPGAQLPDRIVIQRRRINSKVLVDNGETVVIGGIYQENKTEGETKVPFLGDIPVLGYLFKTRTKDSQRRELLVFVTPRIVKEALGVSQNRI